MTRRSALTPLFESRALVQESYIYNGDDDARASNVPLDAMLAFPA